MTHVRQRSGRERGYTLVEVLFAIALFSIVVTLGAAALRHFWFSQALTSSTDELTSEMRALHQNVAAEAHPRVNGIWLRQGSAQWGTFQFDPKGPGTADDVCASRILRSFGAGVSVSAISLPTAPAEINASCVIGLAAVPDDARVALFYARGTATAGYVELTQSNLSRTRRVTIAGLTGRVTRS